MKSGYKLFWTDHALDQLSQTVLYLEENFTEREIQKLADRIEIVLRLVSENPRLFQESDYLKGVRRALVTKNNSLYYRVTDNRIEILSFFSNRQDPEKLKP
ncbi:MAG: type II toxin-antitoxin system RelE/ParE family toxin [Pyrinomonadaceae bacterium]